MERDRRIQQIIGVCDEYSTAKVAIMLLEARLQADPAFLKEWDLQSRVVSNLIRNLEATYLIRLFAEFEAGLRDAWRRAFHRETEPPISDLLEAITARRLISLGWLADVHRVRVYRNSLVHQAQTAAEPVGLIEAREHLCRFFSKLPDRW